jgi:enoyl-CoA hydratase
VISSTGKHFCAGMALDVFAGDDALLATATARARLSFQESLRKLIDCFSAIDEARFPVIAAIQGGCIGGALDLATACDIRVCTSDAFFTVQEIHIGMMADLGVLQRLVKIVPQGVAREMAYTGERLGAERALAVGLVSEVVDEDKLDAAAEPYVDAMITASPVGLRLSKECLNMSVDAGSLEAVIAMEDRNQVLCSRSEEFSEGIRAFLEKRKPVYIKR